METNTLNEQMVRNWLERYKAAWEQNDVSLIGELFSQDAQYWETPFGPVLDGLDEITRY